MEGGGGSAGSGNGAGRRWRQVPGSAVLEMQRCSILQHSIRASRASHKATSTRECKREGGSDMGSALLKLECLPSFLNTWFSLSSIIHQ